jgi:thiol:disulfide interchange protein DsbC
MDAYASYGIAVNYLMFPRKGLDSEGYKKAVAVWCSVDREKALTEAKLGREIEAKDCTNPVAEQYQLGQKIGVSGTPAILLEDGTLIPGFVPPAELAQQLDASR